MSIVAEAPDVTRTIYLPLALCASFGIGSFGISILLNTVTVFFPALMTTVLGQSAAIAGIMLMVSKLYDVIADVGIGLLSDRTRTRIGRRRPYLLAGMVVSALSMVMLFMPPSLGHTGLIVWMMLALIGYSTGYSLFSVPYMAMAGEMTDGYHERTRLLSFRAFFIALGQIASSAGTAGIIAYLGGGSVGYALMGIAAGAATSVTMLICFFGTRTARMADAVMTHRFSKRELLTTLLSNRPFVLLMSIKLSQYVAVALVSTTKLLFLLNVLHVGYVGLINLSFVQNVFGALTVPLWAAVARRIGKRNAYLTATMLLALLYASWSFTSVGITMPELWLRGAINGVAAAGVTLLSISMLPDVMEYDRLRTGLRREGIFSSVYTIVEKLGYALGAGIIGIFLSWAGYIPTLHGAIVRQPATAVHALYLGASFIPAGLILISFTLMLFYALDERVLERMRQRISH